MYLLPSRIALAQTSAVLGDLDRNIANHLEETQKAIEKGADAIIFPELSLTGYTLRDLNFDVALDPQNSEMLAPLRKLSEKISIISGGVELDKSGAVYNSAFFFENGELLASHRKIYPPTYGLFEEMRYFSRGTELRAFDSKRLGRIGMLVCEDLWHTSLPYLLALDGAQMIVTIAASPTRLGTGESQSAGTLPRNFTINHEHHASFARLMSVFLVFVNRIGVEDGVNFWGGSEIVTPFGENVTRGAFFDQDLIFGDIDPELVLRARHVSRHWLDEDLALTKQFFNEIFKRSRRVEELEEVNKLSNGDSYDQE